MEKVSLYGENFFLRTKQTSIYPFLSIEEDLGTYIRAKLTSSPAEAKHIPIAGFWEYENKLDNYLFRLLVETFKNRSWIADIPTRFL